MMTQEHGHPQTTFGSRARLYNAVRPAYPSRYVDWVVRETALHPGATVADIGGGNGRLALEFARRGFHVLLVDPDRIMREMARENLGLARSRGLAGTVEICAGLSSNTGLASQSVDLIAVGNAAHWFVVDGDAEATVAEWKRILTTEGRVALFCLTPSLDDPINKALHEAMSRPDTEGGIAPYRRRKAHFFHERDRLTQHADSLLDPGYARLCDEVVVPSSLGMILNYLNTTSALKKVLTETPRLMKDYFAPIAIPIFRDVVGRGTLASPCYPHKWGFDLFLGAVKQAGPRA
jgi:SAM-dependent methyltransferase